MNCKDKEFRFLINMMDAWHDNQERLKDVKRELLAVVQPALNEACDLFFGAIASRITAIPKRDHTAIITRAAAELAIRREQLEKLKAAGSALAITNSEMQRENN